MKNRLQFRHHTPIFESREAAIEYIYSQIRFADSGLAYKDKSQGYSLLAEPTILTYKNADDESAPGTVPNPHLLLVIGSYTNEGGQYNDNRFCIIDIDKTEAEIAEVGDKVEEIAKALSLITKDSNTLKLYSEQTEAGTVISGDVAVAETQIFNDIRRPNIIMSTDAGIFTYVNLDYNKDENKLIFTVNGETKEWGFNDNSVINGYYSKEDESLHLIRQDGVDIQINMEDVLGEWSVEGEASKTPIVLTREEYKYGSETDESHSHVEPWQDVLKADIRIASGYSNNILEKTSDGRYLYVNGSAKNIKYFRDGEAMTVADALNECAKKRISTDSANILTERADGIFAKVGLDYISNENTLVFTASANSGGTYTHRIQLNSVALFKLIFYDHVTEELVIEYIDSNNELQEVRINIGEMITEWDIVNDAHNVKIHRERVVNGNDKISADVEIAEGNNNILQDVNHQLYVKGTADNIMYSGDVTVYDAINGIHDVETILGGKLDETSGKVDTLREEFDAAKAELDAEIERSKAEDVKHDEAIAENSNKIGTGFSADEHDNVTAHFNALSAASDAISAQSASNLEKIEELSAKTEAEITRASSEEQRIESKFDTKLGDGFDERNTVKDAIDAEAAARADGDSKLQDEINAISANTDGKVADVNAADASINIDKTNPTRPSVKVNIGGQSQDNKANIITLNTDGIFATVDLNYEFDAESNANRLIFTTTNGSKTFDLKAHSVVDRIYYDPTREAIIVEYTINGKRMPDAEVPVGDLIEEISVSNSTDGAIRLSMQRNDSGATPSGPDIISAEVVVSAAENNMLVNKDGALLVDNSQVMANKQNVEDLTNRMASAEGNIESVKKSVEAEASRAISAETALSTQMTSADTQLQTSISTEIANREQEITRVEKKIDDEVSRATAADEQHGADIASLKEQITTEATRAQSAETKIATDLQAEVTRSTDKDNALQASIDTEIADRKNEDAKLAESIAANAVQFKDTTTIGFVSDEGTSPKSVTANVKIANADNNILISDGANAGIYATVKLDYDEATNTLSLIGTNNQELSSMKLGKGSLINSIVYDSDNKDLVISYSDSLGQDYEIRVPVADLFNEWDVKNASENSAIELEKISNTTETGKVDLLTAKVLLAKGFDSEGQVDYGDNILRIVNNGLYASGSGITKAQAACECLDNEMNSLETAVLGHEITQACGEGYAYEPTASASYISAATSMADADKILDQYVASAHTRIDAIEKNDSCVANDLKLTQEKILGFEIPLCSDDVQYPPHADAYYISGATNMDDADALLDKAIHDIEVASGSVNLEAKNNAVYIEKSDSGSTIEIRYLDAGLY